MAVLLQLHCKADGFDEIIVLESHHRLPWLTTVILLRLTLEIVPAAITPGAGKLLFARPGIMFGDQCRTMRKLGESGAS